MTCDRYRVEQDLPDGRRACLYPQGAPITLPVAEFRNNSTWAVVKASRDEESFGILLQDCVGKGQLWTLTVPDAFPDLYRLPSEALSRIREEFPVKGIWLEGPARVSLFVYDNDSFMLYPYVMEDVQRTIVRVHVKDASALYEPVSGRELKPLFEANGEAVFELPAMPGKYTLFSVRR